MSNMSYCRYRNTNQDLDDCICDVYEQADGNGEFGVSKEEVMAFKEMVTSFFDMMSDLKLIDFEGGHLDEEALEELCSKMREKYEYDDDEEGFEEDF